MSKNGSLVIVLALVASVAVGGTARADSAADCGRFFLKYDARTKTMKCVGGKRGKKAPAVNAGQIRRQQRAVQRILNQVQDILSFDDLAGDQQLKWSGKFGQHAKMYPTLLNGYENDEATEFFRQV